MVEIINETETHRERIIKYFAVRNFVRSYLKGGVGNRSDICIDYNPVYQQGRGIHIEPGIDTIRVDLKSLEKKALELAEEYEKNFNCKVTVRLDYSLSSSQ